MIVILGNAVRDDLNSYGLECRITANVTKADIWLKTICKSPECFGIYIEEDFLNAQELPSLPLVEGKVQTYTTADDLMVKLGLEEAEAFNLPLNSEENTSEGEEISPVPEVKTVEPRIEVTTEVLEIAVEPCVEENLRLCTNGDPDTGVCEEPASCEDFDPIDQFIDFVGAGGNSEAESLTQALAVKESLLKQRDSEMQSFSEERDLAEQSYLETIASYRAKTAELESLLADSLALVEESKASGIASEVVEQAEAVKAENESLKTAVLNIKSKFEAEKAKVQKANIMLTRRGLKPYNTYSMYPKSVVSEDADYVTSEVFVDEDFVSKPGETYKGANISAYLFNEQEDVFLFLKEMKHMKGSIIVDFTNELTLAQALNLKMEKERTSLTLDTKELNPYTVKGIKGVDFVPSDVYHSVKLLALNWGTILDKLSESDNSKRKVILLFKGFSDFSVIHTLTQLAYKGVSTNIVMKGTPLNVLALIGRLKLISRHPENLNVFLWGYTANSDPLLNTNLKPLTRNVTISKADDLRDLKV